MSSGILVCCFRSAFKLAAGGNGGVSVSSLEAVDEGRSERFHGLCAACVFVCRVCIYQKQTAGALFVVIGAFGIS